MADRPPSDPGYQPAAAAPLSRREFIKLSVLAFVGAVLAACGIGKLPAGSSAAGAPAAPTPVPTPVPTTTPLPIAPAGSAGPASTLAGSILGRPTNSSITLNTIPTSAGELFVEYGKTAGQYTGRTAAQRAVSGVPIETLIEGLEPNTRYYCRLHAGGDRAGQGSFMTQRAPGSSFVFTIDADPHYGDPNFNAQLYDITLANALADGPDFHVNLGDTFMTEKLKAPTPAQVVGTYADMRAHLGLMGAGAPLFLVNGNHEGELGWLLDGGDQNLAVRCTQTRHTYYPNPTPNAFYSGSATQAPLIGLRDGYYAWTWGDAFFVALDPFWYTRPKPAPQTNANWGWTLGREQFLWLKETLESSAARHKFVFTHQLVGGRDKDGRGGIETAGYYEWGGLNQDGSPGFDTHRPGWGKPIHQLLVENHVSAVFHGHDHVFVKQDLDGVVYQECAQPSITRYDSTQLAADYGYTHGDVRSSSGHLRVTVAPGGVRVEYVRAYRPADETSARRNGQVDYAYTI